MSPIRRSQIAALALALPAWGAWAQASAPLPPLPELTGAAASAAPPASAASSLTGPRLRSPVETGNRALAPGELKPERPVTPQISIPLGKKPAPPTPAEERVVRRGNPAATGGVDDAAARCESQTDEQLRASCRAQLARAGKAKPSN